MHVAPRVQPEGGGPIACQEVRDGRGAEVAEAVAPEVQGQQGRVPAHGVREVGDRNLINMKMARAMCASAHDGARPFEIGMEGLHPGNTPDCRVVSAPVDRGPIQGRPASSSSWSVGRDADTVEAGFDASPDTVTETSATKSTITFITVTV